ncbi:hypothetical protein D5F11_007700 [Siminovitchia terrae]|uniref:Branched-chain amino acid ABC transporter substrate-binding protein n=1 Tax=Siminovitchia terrae TaxID=1914933 RepID=A0A429XA69_SIMTE|nr:hypothetical protein [Siminovitchia terrae]RST60318.1 hypothetical protein D5F11_007700 [Siminovitchia terrae]
MMKKITDERLMIKNLKNIRIAFFIQSLGVIGILLYTAIKHGISGMTSQPLWIVFMLTAIVLGYLQMSISIEHENPDKKIKKGSYFKTVMIILLITIGLGFLITLSPESGPKDGFVVGGVIFLCTLAPYSYIYYLRKKHSEDTDEE